VQPMHPPQQLTPDPSRICTKCGCQFAIGANSCSYCGNVWAKRI
jgi:hypothetical protein